MAILVGFLKRETIKIPPQKHEMLRLLRPDQVRIDGGPHKPAAPALIPGVVHRIDELVQRQEFLPAIGFHSRKYRPGDIAPAIRCSTHAEFNEPVADYRTMTSGGRTTSSGARTTTGGGPTMTESWRSYLPCSRPPRSPSGKKQPLVESRVTMPVKYRMVFIPLTLRARRELRHKV